LLSLSFHEGDEIGIYWYENGDLIFTKNRQMEAVAHQPDFNKVLLDCFIDPHISIVSGLPDTLEKYLPDVLTPTEIARKK
jgi:hypothetical protein